MPRVSTRGVGHINDWNNTKVAGRAFLDDDGDANLEMWVNGFGGRTAEQIADDLDWWEALMEEFAEGGD